MAIRATIERLLSPGFGDCLRCGRPWRHGKVGVDPHCTHYDGGSGCFPLCESCWAGLTPDERLPFYLDLIGRWASTGYFTPAAKVVAITEAVKAGR